MGIILYLISYILKRLLFTFSICYTVIKLILKPKTLNKYFYQLAIGNDQMGNIACQYLFGDALLRKHTFVYFGNPDETISSVLGKAKRCRSLNKSGQLLANLLDAIDKNHVTKSIEEDEGYY